jgi:hypothetical protein
MVADHHGGDRSLWMIFESIVDDVARHRAKGGKGSRKLPGAVRGYLEVLSTFIAGRCCTETDTFREFQARIAALTEEPKVALNRKIFAELAAENAGKELS